jgi:hypothetical protein
MTPWLIGANTLRPTVLRQALYARLRDSGQIGAHEGLTGIYTALWDVKDKYHLLCSAPAAWSARLAKEALAVPAVIDCSERDLPKPAPTVIGSRWREYSAA